MAKHKSVYKMLCRKRWGTCPKGGKHSCGLMSHGPGTKHKCDKCREEAV